MYYSMSIPEILTLLFVLSLWVFSIFLCYKRYRKLTTIERADLGPRGISDNKQNSIGNQNSSLDEVVIENEKINYEKEETTSLLHDEEGDMELDEESSSSSSNNNSNNNNVAVKTEGFMQHGSSSNIKKQNNLGISRQDLKNTCNYSSIQMTHLANSNLSGYGASSNGTSADTSVSNLKDSVYMYNYSIYNSGGNLLKNNNSEAKYNFLYENPKNTESQTCLNSKMTHNNSNIPDIQQSKKLKSLSLSISSNKVCITVKKKLL